MAKKLSKLQLAQKKAEVAWTLANKKIEELGEKTSELYGYLSEIQMLFDRIRNVPPEDKLRYEKFKAVRLNWKQQTEEIELQYRKNEAKAVGQGVAGIGAGVAVVALGPSAAMGIATTFGVASTGTAISTLSGAAATNAALAWLGGGALSVSGGGMAAGSAFLTMFGPVGWTIAGVASVSSLLILFKSRHDKKHLENIYTLISERDDKLYELAIVELSERIERVKNEGNLLSNAIIKIESFGTDYRQMSEAEQYELGSYVNLMEASTMLLVNPILGLRAKYTEEMHNKFCEEVPELYKEYFDSHKLLIIFLANLLYKIELDDKDKKLLCKAFKKNKEFLTTVGIKKKEFAMVDLYMTEMALDYSYKMAAM